MKLGRVLLPLALAGVAGAGAWVWYAPARTRLPSSRSGRAEAADAAPLPRVQPATSP